MHGTFLKKIGYFSIYVFIFIWFSFSSQSISVQKVIFPHAAHESELNCRDCHHIYSNNPNNHFPEMEKCLDCHDETELDNYSRKSYATSSYSTFSHLVHSNYSCKDCHHIQPSPLSTISKTSNCINCHKRQKPNSHTGFFRIRGHGIQAEIDSNKCSHCHRSTFCVRCHRSTKPLNHRGNWSNTHGKAIPGGYGGNISKCSTCHKSAWCSQCHNRKLRQ